MTVLAEALAQRKDLVKRIGELDDLIGGALVIEERETAADTATEMARARSRSEGFETELVQALAALQAIENQIRAKNADTEIRFEGKVYSLSQAIVLRDALKTEYNARNSIADSVANSVEGDSFIGRRYRSRRSKEEIRLIAVTNPDELRERRDAVGRRVRLLDVEIQKANWSVEV